MRVWRPFAKTVLAGVDDRYWKMVCCPGDLNGFSQGLLAEPFSLPVDAAIPMPRRPGDAQRLQRERLDEQTPFERLGVVAVDVVEPVVGVAVEHAGVPVDEAARDVTPQLKADFAL